MDNKKLIAVGGLIVALGVGGFFYVNEGFDMGGESNTHGTSQESIPEEVQEGEVIITMTEDGYNPSVVRIKVGTTVIFVNEDEFGHWPASDVHPTHEIYSEFDPLEPVPPGESWSFTFEETGEWDMHDHLAPYITGTIIVEE